MEFASDTIALVGRHREMARLLAMLDAAIAGRGALAMLSGEPGIGKTRLAQEISARAEARGALALWARCWEESGSPAHWIWIQILRGCAEALGADSVPLADRDAILAAMPAMRAEFRAPAGSSTPQVSADADSDRFRLFDAVAATLRNVSRKRPLLIVLDDLHAADQGSLSLLRFFGRHLASSRIIALATWREEEVRLASEKQSCFADLARIGENFSLGALAEMEAAELIRLSGAVEPAAAAVSRLYRASDGNPFFLKEMVRLLMAEAGARAITLGDGFPLPDTVRSAIQKRVALAPQDSRLALGIASAIGNEFDSSLLIELIGAKDTEVLHAIQDAIGRGLLERGSGSGHYRFSHPLIAETLRRDLGEAERKQLHLKLAQILDRSGREPRPAEAAYHYCQALPLGDAQTAALKANAAAEQARRALAFEEAARWYAMALSAAEAARVAALDRCEVLLALGESQFYAQRFDAFRSSFREAITIARSRENANQFARAVLGLGLLPPDAGASDPALATLSEEALAMLGESDPALRVKLLNQLAERIGALGWTGDRRSSELTAQAVEIGRRAGAPEVLAEALYGRYFALRGPDGLEARVLVSAEIAALVERHRLSGWEFRTGYYRAADLLEACDDGVWGELAQLQRAGNLVRIGHPGVVEATEAMRALIQRAPEEAERMIEAARTAGMVRPNAVAKQIYAMQVFALRREQGRAEELADSLRRAISRAPALLFSRCALALVCADAQRGAETAEHFDRVSASDFAAGRRDYTWMLSVAMLAEACFLTNDAARAARLHPVLAGYRGRNVAIGALLCYGSIGRYLAMLESAAGRFDEAERMFDEAEASDRRLGAPVLIARGKLQRAISRARAGDVAGAQGALSSASEAADELGLFQVGSQAQVLKQSLENIASPPEKLGSRRGQEANVFRPEGDFWTIRFQGKPAFRIRDAKGLAYLAALLRSPLADIRALDLVGGGEKLPDSGDGGEMLDAQARADYRRRLSELGEELEEAKARGKVERAMEIEDEIEMITRELSRAVGLGGRERRAVSVSERARLNVTRAIKAAIERIGEKDAALGLHFSTAIRTGTYCSYRPDPATAISWHF